MTTHDSANTSRKSRLRALWSLVFLAWPTEALAHGSIAIGDFYSGLLHPVSHTEVALAVVALGFLAGQMTAGPSWSTARVFVLSVLVGSVLGLLSPGLPWSSMTVTISLVVLGTLVAVRVELPAKFTVGLAFFFGLSVGYANGSQMLANLKMPIFYVGGLTVCVGFLLLYCVQVVRRFRAFWFQTAVRVMGSWIAATGALILAFQVQ
jgi:hydrogenase/urease accessory protein HupE